MDIRNLGRSGLRVSSLCLGTMTFGEADERSVMHELGCDEATSFAIMDRALERGINVFDTANIYGQDGLSERVIGRWFARSGQRDRVVLATKFRFTTEKHANGRGGSRLHIVRAAEGSLKRLQTDRIDLYQIHMQDIETPEEETLRALDDLVRQGKVLYTGCSNYAAYRIVDSAWTSRSQNLERFVAAQMQYSLLERGIEREHVPACLQFGLGILSWSPLANGFLSGKYRRGEGQPEGSRYAKWADRFERLGDREWAILEVVRNLAAERGTTPATVALAWILRKPAVTSVIIGARSVEQLEQNLAAAELTLDDDALARLDEVSDPKFGYPYDFIGRVQKRW